MTPERWQRVDRAFHTALSLEGEAREQYLAQTCGDDSALHSEVFSLIAAHEQADKVEAEHNYFGQCFGLLAGRVQAGEATAPGAAIADQVGPYSVVGLLGSGGMGTVFLAERSDDAYRRRVAIKVMAERLRSAEMRRRFLVERQALAELDHPNIARLYDGDSTPEGAPYIVMELVNGVPIDAYCDRERLTLEQRINLFLRVCDAVQHAHRNLILHRDIKPANLLVTEEGVPKLLDFGVAKLLAEEDSADDTHTGQLPMTLAYASPEMVRGASASVASDVYSLAVVLYRLLCGVAPFSGEASIPAALRTREVRPPSATIESSSDGCGAIAERRRTDPKQLRRQLAGDLDNILLKALHNEPERRYPSVEQLADDLTRHLESRPVKARPDSLGYRASRFVLRHRVGVAMTGLLMLLILSLISSLAYQTAKLSREQRVSEQRRATAEKTLSLLVSAFEASTPEQSRGAQLTAREVLDRGTDKVIAQLADQPLAQATLLDAIGRVYQNLGAYAEAEASLRRAVELQRKDGSREDLARCLFDLGTTLTSLGKLELAEARHREALDLRRQLVDRSDGHQAEIAESIGGLAAAAVASGRFEQGANLYAQSLSLMDAAHRPQPQTALLREGLGLALLQRNQPKEAHAQLQRALATLEPLLGQDHPDALEALDAVATADAMLGNKRDAVAVTRRVVTIYRRLLGPHHPKLADSLSCLGSYLCDLHEYDDAENALRESLDIAQEIYPPGHLNRIQARFNLAMLYFDRRDLDRAETMLNAANKQAGASLPPGHPALAYLALGLARLDLARKHYNDAHDRLEHTLEALRPQMPEPNPMTAEARGLLGEALEGLGRLEEAEQNLTQSYRSLMELSAPGAASLRLAGERLETFHREHPRVPAGASSVSPRGSDPDPPSIPNDR